MRWIGAAFGMYVIATIGLYHVLVVQGEKRFGLRCWGVFFAAGVLCLLLSLFAQENCVSLFWGYNACLHFWSIKEIWEQPNRRRIKEKVQAMQREDA